MEVFMSRQASHEDAKLVLELYDLRREAEMRKARNFIAQFSPNTADDVLGTIYNFTSSESAWIRQVLSYWEMAASLVNRGVLHEGLADDTLHEMWFVYAKFKPLLKDLREKLKSPAFMQSIEQYAESTPERRQRVQDMISRQAELRKMAASRANAAD
jgi:hypothetical protein